MQALIFDFDGLILDTETPEYEVWVDIFAAHGLAIPDGYWTTVMGRGAEQEVERPAELLARLSGASVEFEEVRQRIRERIDTKMVRPGVATLLKEAQAAHLPVGIASSSKHIWVERHLARHGLLQEFPIIVCADDAKRAKPFPDLYLLACKLLDASPERCVALEDSPNGVAAAKAAGLFTVAVPNEVTATLAFEEADLRIEDLSRIELEHLRRAFESVRT